MLDISRPDVHKIPLRHGEVYRYEPKNKFNRIKLPIFFSSDEAACVYRDNSCFMRVKIIRTGENIPRETQYILAREGNTYRLIYALSDNGTRACLNSSESGTEVTLDTYSDEPLGSVTEFLYTVCGENPYKLFKEGAAVLAARFPNLLLRKEKKIPDFTGFLGFCTYNAFYADYDSGKLEKLLDLFENHKQKLGFLLLDEGWQSVDEVRYMSGFDADKKKFPEGLHNFAQKVKSKYGIRYLILWHVFIGYWAGVIGFDKYGVKDVIFEFQEKRIGSAVKSDTLNTMGEFYPSNLCGIRIRYIDDGVDDFYDDFYKYLSECGVDGCKVDAFGWAEVIGRHGAGGNKMLSNYVKAMTNAADKHFNGSLISCSCNGNNFLFDSFTNTVTRNTEDYQPNVRDSHGNHILYNAHNVLWLGEFFNCDFDMFQSGQLAGEFHAKNRAVSGGAIYVTDELDKIRFDIISKIATKDGKVPVMDTYPKLTRDSLFLDPFRDKKLLKQFNTNGDILVLAIFNCLSNEAVKGKYCLGDIPLSKHGCRYLVYSSDRGFLGIVCDPDYGFDIELQPLQAELISFIPIYGEETVIGLKGKYLPAAFVDRTNKGICTWEAGTVMMYSEEKGYYEIDGGTV